MKALYDWWRGGSPSARAARTAWQVFFATFVVALYDFVTAYGSTGTVDLEALWKQGVVMGVAAVIAWWMNR